MFEYLFAGIHMYRHGVGIIPVVNAALDVRKIHCKVYGAKEGG